LKEKTMNHSANLPVVSNPNQMPEQDFLALGVRDIAYVRPLTIGDGDETKIIFAIHTANGTAVGAAETRELAFSAVRENGLEPVSWH
jgi:hypothetical protein